MNKDKAQALIEDYFRKKVQKDSKIHNAYLLVHSEKLGIHLNIAEGLTGQMSANAQQPYYIASVSKLFTAVIIGILVEKAMISYEDPISSYLDNNRLNNLHIYKGKEYTNEIRIKHLLNHTSGLNDFVEDKPKQGKSMIDMIMNETSRTWTPQEAIEWSKSNLRSHFPPGKGFHYSDTGYHLLGLIIEHITTKPFHEVLRQYIYEPLGMNHSYFGHYSEPIVANEYPVAHLFVGKQNIIDFPSFSFMYAGGGIVATVEDSLKFMKALVNYEILTEKTIEIMKNDWARFFIGIDYGYGLMNFTTVPLLMPQKYNVWGNAGSTGSFMFYHVATDSYLIGSLNQFRYHRKGIRLMLKIIDILLQCDES